MKNWQIAMGMLVGLMGCAVMLIGAVYIARPLITQAQALTLPVAASTPALQPAANGGASQPRGGLNPGGNARTSNPFINAAVSVTGLTVQEIVTDLGNGQSLAQIAAAHGKTADDVVQAARADFQTQLHQAVSAGQLTQAEADQHLAQFDQSAAQVVNTAGMGFRRGQGGGPRSGFGRGGRNLFLNAAASVTGLTVPEVVTDLSNGQSLAQIAAAHGKTADDVIQAARAQFKAQLDQAVSAGQLTQAEADQRLAQFDQVAPQVVNNSGGSGGPNSGPSTPGDSVTY